MNDSRPRYEVSVECVDKNAQRCLVTGETHAKHGGEAIRIILRRAIFNNDNRLIVKRVTVTPIGCEANG